MLPRAIPIRTAGFRFLTFFLALAASCLTAAIAWAQGNQPLLQEKATRVSEHVHVIMGFPNVAIVVGSRATLVVDTGLGPRNGETVVRVAKQLSNNPKLFLTTTHFHPEHAGGEPGFPANTILIRDTVQQEEMEQHGAAMMDAFRSRSAQNAELLAGVKLRTPDILFPTEATIDLGGATARLMWLGAAHTKGDELIFVEPDRTLIPGDIVQSKLVPSIPGSDGSVKSWIAILDKLAPLNPAYVVPDHGELGDGSLIAKERAFLGDVQSRALELKRQGVAADDAGKQLVAGFKTKYPDWPNLNPIANLVRRVYAESQ
ncbi:MAG TPA: MBL fold metallo-hydrolase [Bryobacteraceae bacterium]|nr:MBL fold metallo-hydrolase [Bryobacteraceae bacterium]